MSETTVSPLHRSGFANIVGNPNVGKSTLMNLLTGENLSIVTSKAQTTRHRIIGIVNGDDYQIVYSDTPGVLKPHYKMQEIMLRFAGSALTDADVLLYVTDVEETVDTDSAFFKRITTMEIPVLLIINKIDLVAKERTMEVAQWWRLALPKAEIFVISAKVGFQVEALTKRIVELMPFNPPYFPKDDEMSDRPLRFFVAEIVREKILVNYHDEIPYSVEVVTESYKEKADIISIRCIIYVARESQKGIILGKGGSAIKRVGIQARTRLEEFLGNKVYLDLQVKVSDDWRNDDRQLSRFGYTSE